MPKYVVKSLDCSVTYHTGKDFAGSVKLTAQLLHVIHVDRLT